MAVASITLATSQVLPSDSHQKPEQLQGAPEDVTLAVSDGSGNHIGSAVSVQIANGRHWAVTNRHVVGKRRSVCLTTRSGVSYAFNVVQRPSTEDPKERLDIALLWASMESTKDLPIARWEEQPDVRAETLPIVEAFGYPSSLLSPGRNAELVKSRGLLVPLIDGALEEGFDTTYTAEVQKGMSGGGVFLDQKLIAINGAHSDPAWPVFWKYKSGKPVSEGTNDRLSVVSIGISKETIDRELTSIEPATARQSDNSIQARCNIAKRDRLQ